MSPLVPLHNADDESEPVYDPYLWKSFMKLHPETRFIFVQWVDYVGTMRTRIIPAIEFQRLVETDQRFTISKGNLGTLQDDTMTSVCNTTGQMYVEPDLATLRPTWHGPAPAATVTASFKNADGVFVDECPRGGLQVLLDQLSQQSIQLLIGFEIEVTFLRRNPENASDPYLPLTTNHAWGTLTSDSTLR